ncbi:hypothetical protein HDU99_000327 [Rhizoclosmatium hyalinum]|nr:hypothetical protein HDU99_000327 [Rhizoclosmatium hyalinum]
MEEIAELKPKAMKTKAVKKDVKGKGRAVPLDSDLGEVQPLPPRRATRKAKATAIIESESDEPEPKEDVVEIKKGARRATSSKTRPAKKQRKKADDSEDDFGVGSDDEDVREDDEFDESAVVAKPSKKRPALNEVESKSMKREQKYKAVKVLMLSAKDSVSGLNLTEATHCIIMHPFHDNKEDYAIGAEKQGVARTLRNGQTKTVKIVRFVVERTVEQEMHDRRVDKLKD